MKNIQKRGKKKSTYTHIHKKNNISGVGVAMMINTEQDNSWKVLF